MSEKDEEVLLEEVRELRKGRADRGTADSLGEKRILAPPADEKAIRREMSARTRRNFIIGGATALAGVLGWRWMPDETKQRLLRRTFEFNERVSQLFYSPARLAPEFPLDQVSPRRVNGMEGLEGEMDVTSWRLRITGLAGGDAALAIDDLRNLPRTEMTVELKCIEGWSVVVNWAGVRFSDLVNAFPPATVNSRLPRYVSLATPDLKYYVGWDMPSILHPQTLLAYGMNGEPLRPEHGAPLRLASPTKYGIKQIKRIGLIEFTDQRPADFWAERGYDWYAGH
jgi:DMSO/TMAO reductase YedYZ molybdopterin-dependent catalytic subunit